MELKYVSNAELMESMKKMYEMMFKSTKNRVKLSKNNRIQPICIYFDSVYQMELKMQQIHKLKNTKIDNSSDNIIFSFLVTKTLSISKQNYKK